MKVIESLDSLSFSGVLDENTSNAVLIKAYDDLKARGIKEPISVNLSQVMYANSTGIMLWLKFLNHTKASFKYVEAPLWLVDHFNILAGFFEHGCFVVSLQAPYVSLTTNESKAYTLTLGQDLPVIPDYTHFQSPNKTENGIEYQPDFSPQSHFAFIAKNFEIFSQKLKS